MSIKVLVIDSSEVCCHALSHIINQQTDMQVISVAHDATAARKLIKSIDIDVLTLAVNLPKMNGLKFLEKLMKVHPMPVVLISTLAVNGSAICSQAFKLGARACILKPKLDKIAIIANEISDKIRLAVQEPVLQKTVSVSKNNDTTSIKNERFIIAIGASTGGTQALTSLLSTIPVTSPGIVITQHMPQGFTDTFASRLDSQCQLMVCEATHDEMINVGCAYIAPGNKHMQVTKKRGRYYTVISDSEPVNLHKPSIDLLFESVANNAGRYAVGVILTGMGKDGASGLLKIQNNGGKTIAQDEDSSVVYGMAKQAVSLGGVNQELSLENISAEIMHLVDDKM
ncbi:MAG: chemotaxis response regulator protein-glutamate methylesterase [Psychromonas sp.]|nr:chemotaxis response regulator protein-glutamate methylesterase [Psychromonas sp.]